MLNDVIDFIQQHSLIKSGSTVVVGLSGGPDSVCLLHLLYTVRDRYNLSLIAAHIDHEWRPTSSYDALVCKTLTESLDIPFVQLKASESQVKATTGSLEDLGRRIRRSFFEEIARDVGAQSIALAHHAQDQQETFFLRMIRGASISGLASIRPHHGLYIRPLLKVTKTAIFEYLAKHNLSYCTDSTNESDSYLRNAIRLHVIPAITQCDSRFEKNFDSMLTHIQETELFLERITNAAFERVTHRNHEGLFLDKSLFFAEDPFLHHRLILLWLCAEKASFTPSTSLFNEIVRFLRNAGTSHQLTPQWSLIQKDRYVTLKKSNLVKAIHPGSNV